MFSSEYCKTLKNTFSAQHLRTTTSRYLSEHLRLIILPFLLYLLLLSKILLNYYVMFCFQAWSSYDLVRHTYYVKSVHKEFKEIFKYTK